VTGRPIPVSAVANPARAPSQALPAPRRLARPMRRYTRGGFVVASGPGGADIRQRAALRQAALQELAARGVTIESGGAGSDTRMDEFRQRESARQYVEQAMRDQIGRRIPGKGM
jgi:hypothetical protein